MKNLNQIHQRLEILVFASLLCMSTLQAQNGNKSSQSQKENASSSKEENNRNVMLNAASANGPGKSK